VLTKSSTWGLRGCFDRGRVLIK